MLFDKISKGNKRKTTLRHKVTIYLFCIIILTYLITEIIRINILKLNSPFNIIASVIIFISYTFIISWLTANWLSFKLARQVNRMTDIAIAISNSRDLKKRMKISNHPDELSNLEEALNSMLSQLENSFEKQRQFVSDASHELRTPVSIMKGYLDILDEWGKKDLTLLEESIGSMKGSVK